MDNINYNVNWMQDTVDFLNNCRIQYHDIPIEFDVHTVLRGIELLCSGTEKQVFMLRHEGYTLGYIANHLGVSTERIRQILHEVRYKLKLRYQSYCTLTLQEVTRLLNLQEQNLKALIASPSPDTDSQSTEEVNTRFTPIEDLDLSVRSWHSLARSGITTVEDLVTRTPSQVRRIRNLGEKSMKEIESKLHERGLSLAHEDAV